MKLHELRSVRAVVEAGFQVTTASECRNASQPGVSRHLQQVETSLGVQLFERRKHRLVGLTVAGQVLVPMINRALDQLEGVRRIAGQFRDGEQGCLTVATSHTHAQYLLPPVIEEFIGHYPKVRLTLKQGYASQIIEWLDNGEADISVCTQPAVHPESIVFHPIRQLHRILLVPSGHALLKNGKPRLHDLVKFPLITYGPEFAAHAKIVNAFDAQGLKPMIALFASDTETIKTYVSSKLGVAVVADSAYQLQRDKGLRSIDVRHLFASSTVAIGIHRERAINVHALKLMERLAPGLRLG